MSRFLLSSLGLDLWSLMTWRIPIAICISTKLCGTDHYFCFNVEGRRSLWAEKVVMAIAGAWREGGRGRGQDRANSPLSTGFQTLGWGPSSTLTTHLPHLSYYPVLQMSGLRPTTWPSHWASEWSIQDLNHALSMTPSSSLQLGFRIPGFQSQF